MQSYERAVHVPVSPLPVEFDLCQLMQSMKLATGAQAKEEAHRSVSPPAQHFYDDAMSDATSECSSSDTPHGPIEAYGCGYLQAIRHQLDSYPTTGGDYLDAVFTHRELFLAHPGGHRDCARLYSDIAYAMEQRAWRADRDADAEAVAAFRHEAWMIASSLPSLSQPAPQQPRSNFACTMPLM